MAEKLMRWITKGQNTVDFLNQLKERIIIQAKKILKGAAYWSAVVLIGLFVAAGIMQRSGVPVLEQTRITYAVGGSEAASDIQLGNTGGVAANTSNASKSSAAAANASSWVGTIFGSIIYYAGISILGPIAAVIAFLFDVIIGYPYDTAYWSKQAKTGGFVNVSSVIIGWRLVRDICNIFFSLILIIIALATVLKIEAYAWKQSLSKFLVAVILINFSKSIAGLFTDVATVITATFAGSFASGFSKGLFAAFGLHDMLSYNLAYNSTAPEAVSNGSGIFFSYVIALVVIFVFCMFMIYYMAVLIFRIIMLQFLIVMSPLAFIANILPTTKKYATQWWSMFGRWVMTAPLIAFFFWLTLTMLYATGDPNEQTVSGSGTSSAGLVSGVTDGTLNEKAGGLQNIGPVKAATPSAIGSVLIASVMLMASSKLVKSMASEGGSLLGKVESAAPGLVKGGAERWGRFIQNRGQGFDFRKRDEKGNIAPEQSWWRKGTYGLGQTTALFGATVGQPFTNTEKYLEQRKKVKEAKKKKREAERAKFLEGHAQADVLYDAQGNRISGGQSALGTLRMLWGSMGASGTDVGEHYIANVLSWKGAKSGYDLWSTETEVEEKDKDGNTVKVKKNTFDAYRDARAKLDRTRTQKDDEEKRLTSDEAPEAEKDLAKANKTVKQYDKIAEDVQNSPVSEISLKIPEMHLIFQGHLDELNRQREDALNRGVAADHKNITELDTQIQGLEMALKRDDKIRMQDVEDYYSGYHGDPTDPDYDPAAKKRLVDGVKERVVSMANGKKDEFDKERKALQDRMTATGYTFDAAYNVVGTGTNFATETQRAQLRKDLDDAQKNFDNLSQKTAALGPGENIASRVAYTQALHEAEGKIRGLNINDLFTYLERAIKNKDAMMVDAISNAIAGEGFMQDMLKKQVGKSGTAGMHEYTNNVLIGKLGMNTQAARRLAINISGTAADKAKDFSTFALYNYDPRTGYAPHDPDPKKAEAARVQMILKYLSTQNKSTLSQLKWTSYLEEKDDGSVEVSDLGKGIINFAGDDFAKERIWNNMPTKSKDYMSLPDVTRGLRTAGAPAHFVSQLEDWHRNRPFDPTNPVGQTRRRLTSRLAA